MSVQTVVSRIIIRATKTEAYGIPGDIGALQQAENKYLQSGFYLHRHDNPTGAFVMRVSSSTDIRGYSGHSTW